MDETARACCCGCHQACICSCSERSARGLDETARAVVEQCSHVCTPTWLPGWAGPSGACASCIAAALQAAVQAATGYSPLLSCCRDAKAHVEHRVTDAVQAERERCAKIAENSGGIFLPQQGGHCLQANGAHMASCHGWIAAAIRGEGAQG